MPFLIRQKKYIIAYFKHKNIELEKKDIYDIQSEINGWKKRKNQDCDTDATASTTANATGFVVSKGNAVAFGVVDAVASVSQS